MRKGFGLVLVLVGLIIIGAVGAYAMKADYWLLSPRDKFLRSWREDLTRLQKAKTLPTGWDHVRTINVRSDNSPAADWVDALKARIPTDPSGTYQLNIIVIHWIDGTRYGAIIQYNLTDTKSGNTVWEISRTLHLGYLI